MPMLIVFGGENLEPPNSTHTQKWDFRVTLFRIGYYGSILSIVDRNNSWYSSGIQGISSNHEGTKDFLKREISIVNPSEVIMMGTSSGGSAALMYGIMINADRVISFVPRTIFNTSELQCIGDNRFTYSTNKANKRNLDIQNVNQLYPTNIHATIITGDNEIDVIHAQRALSPKAPNIYHCMYPGYSHIIVREMLEDGILDDILKKYIVRANSN